MARLADTVSRTDTDPGVVAVHQRRKDAARLEQPERRIVLAQPRQSLSRGSDQGPPAVDLDLQIAS